MIESTSCEQSCDDCPSKQVEQLTLDLVQDRFQKEAKREELITKNYRLPYFVWGEGPPLVFIHGLADSRDSFLWVSALLSGSFRCIAYDLPMGRGDGAKLRRCTPESLVEDLIALVDHVEAPKSYLFASSYGSTIALSAMNQYASRFPRAILQGGVAHQPLSRTERLLAWVMSHTPGSLRLMPLRRKILAKLHHAAFESRPDVWEFYLDYTGQLPIRALGRHARLLHHVDLREQLPMITQPILLVRGEQDVVIRTRSTETLLHGLPNVGCVSMDEAGHIPSLSHPEELTTIIRRFLTPPKSECESQAGECTGEKYNLCESSSQAEQD